MNIAYQDDPDHFGKQVINAANALEFRGFQSHWFANMLDNQTSGWDPPAQVGNRQRLIDEAGAAGELAGEAAGIAAVVYVGSEVAPLLAEAGLSGPAASIVGEVAEMAAEDVVVAAERGGQLIGEWTAYGLEQGYDHLREISTSAQLADIGALDLSLNYNPLSSIPDMAAAAAETNYLTTTGLGDSLAQLNQQNSETISGGSSYNEIAAQYGKDSMEMNIWLSVNSDVEALRMDAAHNKAYEAPASGGLYDVAAVQNSEEIPAYEEHTVGYHHNESGRPISRIPIGMGVAPTNADISDPGQSNGYQYVLPYGSQQGVNYNPYYNEYSGYHLL